MRDQEELPELEAIGLVVRQVFEESLHTLRRAGMPEIPVDDQAPPESMFADISATANLFAAALPTDAPLDLRVAAATLDDVPRFLSMISEISDATEDGMATAFLGELLWIALRIGAAHDLLAGLKATVIERSELWLQERQARSAAATATNALARKRRQRQKDVVVEMVPLVIKNESARAWSAPKLAQYIFENWTTNKDGRAIDRPDVAKITTLAREAIAEGRINLPPSLRQKSASG